jgi:hypothetical protein
LTEYRKFFAPRDIVAVLCLSVISCALCLYFARGNGGSRAEITVDGEAVASLSLGENRVYSPPGMPAVRIAVRNGAAGFVSSDCPDKVCVHSGFLSLRGQSAVCLPNRVVLRISGRETAPGDALDGVTY